MDKLKSFYAKHSKLVVGSSLILGISGMFIWWVAFVFRLSHSLRKYQYQTMVVVSIILLLVGSLILLVGFIFPDDETEYSSEKEKYFYRKLTILSGVFFAFFIIYVIAMWIRLGWLLPYF